MDFFGFEELCLRVDLVLKSDFRKIQKDVARVFEEILGTKEESGSVTPGKKESGLKKTPSTYFSTPKKNLRRKLMLTPKKGFSSGKSSRKNSGNSGVDPDSLFGKQLKVNLYDIFQGYVSSSDESNSKTVKISN